MTGFDAWFAAATGYRPMPWQLRLGEAVSCGNRTIRIPTGFGKTAGVLAAWTYHRVHRRDSSWPARLVWCLPMRVLVEQTYAEAVRLMQRLDLGCQPDRARDQRVGVHLLMGGVDAGDWHLWPEASAVLIGTQDMLLSRALNRGYAAARARWPVDFGMLNQDVLWVMDEVQLMDVGLATSAQLQAFRQHHAPSRPSATWWMSATLQPDWLVTRDTQDLCAVMSTTEIPEGDRVGHLWDDVTKPVIVRTDGSRAADLACLVAEAHGAAGSGRDGPTLVVVNTVDRAVELAAKLRESPALASVDLRLVHRRYRAGDRAAWRDDFLNRGACGPGTNRIIVATQVVEAGVDVSAALLVTDLAPWPSLVQRFGRAARGGGAARVIVVDTAPKDDRAAAPYQAAELDAAREVLRGVDDVAPRALEKLERSLDPAQRARLYPYDPTDLIQEHEVEQLFDTTPDLSGADIDVSRFIRGGEERDLSVFWADVPDQGEPSAELQPERAAICAVPFLRARAWLCGQKRRLLKPRSAWVWSWLEGRWRVAEASDLYPGALVLVDANLGGYDWEDAVRRGDGWSPGSKKRVEPRDTGEASAMDRADAAQDDESTSAARFRTIGTHGRDVAEVAVALAGKLAPRYAPVLETAALWHDVGKSHPAFQGSIRRDDRPRRDDLAKAPRDAWPRWSLYRMPDGGSRPGFRHELATVLAMFQVLREVDPAHAALLGPWLGSPLLDEAARARAVPTRTAATDAERRILALSADEFDLAAYLVSAHHGKVRVSWHASPSDQLSSLRDGAVTIRGVRTGDVLPSVRLSGGDRLPELRLDLAPSELGLSTITGASFTERALRSLRRLGPFELAWLEAVFRAADARASSIAEPDPVLATESNHAHP